MAKIIVLDPTVQPEGLAIPTLSAADALAGKRVGFLNNGWLSWDAMISYLQREAQQQYGATAVDQWRVPVSSAAPNEVLDQVGETSDLVLAGLAN